MRRVRREFDRAMRGDETGLTGEATLTHLEDQFGVKVTLTAGVGQFKVFVAENVGAKLQVGRVRTDQSYLTQTLRELDGAIAASWGTAY